MTEDHKLFLEKGRLYGFEKEILAAGLCSFFMPVRFIELGQKVHVMYDCSGYAAAGEMKEPDIGKLLDIMEGVFQVLSASGEYYIEPDRIALTGETVFYDEAAGKVKIAYLPVREGARGIRNNAGGFIREMKEKAPSDMRGYFIRMQECLQLMNYTPQDMTDLISGMKRELRICGI